MPKRLFQIFSQNKLAIFLIAIGTIVWSLTMVKSGLPSSYGLGFWGANGHDGIWHIALSESLARGGLQMPTFAGATLQNYHIGFDLLLALVNKITKIPTSYLYFQIFPVVLAFLIGFLSYLFVISWTKSKSAALWSTFFVYFGGSFGWLITLFRSGDLGGESMFWSTQAISTLINPPFALSLVFILLGLITLLKKDKKLLDYIFCTLCFGILIQIKAYAGVLVLGALLVSGIWKLLRQKKSNILILFFSSLFLSLIIFLPFNKSPQSLLVFQPFWFLETMMGLSDRLGWLKFYSAMTNYRSGDVLLKGILAYSVAFLIFWYGNIGTRLVKEVLVFKWIKNFKKLTWVEIFIGSIIVAGGVVPMFFLQKGTPWNTIQFFYYSLFFSGILAGIATDELTKSGVKKPRTLFIKVGILVLTIPTVIGTLWQVYLPSRPPAMLSKDELKALSFLSNQPQGVVLTYPFDSILAKNAESNPPRPLYLYTSTAYVSAFSKKETFLEDEINLDITNYDWKERNGQIKAWYEEKDQSKAREFLKKNNIKYIYWLKGQRALLGEGQLGLSKIFENTEVDLFKVE